MSNSYNNIFDILCLLKQRGSCGIEADEKNIGELVELQELKYVVIIGKSNTKDHCFHFIVKRIVSKEEIQKLIDWYELVK